MSEVKISVVTATWNCRGTIEECLASFEKQTHPYKEHVLVDGASTDGTVDIISNSSHRIDCFVSEPDSGIYDALNKGIRLSSGDVVGFLHADDFYADPFVLADIAAKFSDPEICAVYGDLQYVRKDDAGHVVRSWRSSSFSRLALMLGWMPPHPTLYVRKEWYQRIGGFDDSYRISADYLSILRLFSDETFSSAHIPRVLIRMRIGGESNRSLRNIVRKSREDIRAMRAAGFGFFQSILALLWKNVSKVGQFF